MEEIVQEMKRSSNLGVCMLWVGMDVGVQSFLKLVKTNMHLGVLISKPISNRNGEG